MGDWSMTDPGDKMETLCIHAGHDPAALTHKEVEPHISLSTIFAKYADPDSPGGYLYGRNGNPTRETLEKRLAAIEGAKYALVYASGSAAISAAADGMCGHGGEIICHDNIYAGTIHILRNVASRRGIKTNFIDMTNLELVRQSITPETKLVWLEGMTNPFLVMFDISAICDIVKEKGSQAKVIVDNTVPTPYFMHPLSLGADVVLHSVTKYLNGHDDVIMGALCMNDKELYDVAYLIQNGQSTTSISYELYMIYGLDGTGAGGIPSPFDCYLTLRGIQTLPLRMKKHMENGLMVAQFLEKHPCVERVIHPGLDLYEYKDLLRKQCRGYPGMIALYVKGGEKEVKSLMKNLHLVYQAGSLGGTSSVIRALWEGYLYGRCGNPTRETLEKRLAAIEGAKYEFKNDTLHPLGIALVFASGSAAISAAADGMCGHGGEIICHDNIYAGTIHILRNVASRRGIKTNFIDMTNLELVRQSITPETKLVWLEGMTNPFLVMFDISAICDIVKEKGSQAKVIVDNTVPTPYFMHPLSLGADVVLHSVTKYLNGHDDVIMGALCMNDKELYDVAYLIQNGQSTTSISYELYMIYGLDGTGAGGIPSPFDCYLTLRGIQTLPLRMKKHMENGLMVARFLEKHPCVERHPLSLGADVVLHSVTKYLNGHDDVIMGALCMNDKELYDVAYLIQNGQSTTSISYELYMIYGLDGTGAGGIPSPFDCYLTLRGIQTLPLRMKKHMENGLMVARFLEKHPCVERVIHPGLDSYEYKDLLRKQCRGYPGMIALYVKGGEKEVKSLMKNLHLLYQAASLGGTSSIIRALHLEGNWLPSEEDNEKGVTANLLRISVGLENPKDIIADLDHALRAG
ncbi:unnamed protein product, partial [Darwinula stevensoni]